MVLVTKNFKFSDGIYLTFNAFQQNRPDYKWEDVNHQVFINGDSFISKAEDFFLASGEKILAHDIWGYTYNGIAYIRVEPIISPNKEKEIFATFSAIRVRGELSYFIYTEEIEKWVEINAYNPIDGRPFRTGKVLTTESATREKILHFQTGEIEDFSLANFLRIVATKDIQLWNALKDLPAAEAQEKLFKCLLIYDDRHEVFTKG